LGNYWSDYEEKYPDAEKENGYWDIPYENDEEDVFTDEYPMVKPSIPYIEIEEPTDYMRTKDRNVMVEWTGSYRYKEELEYEVRLKEREWEKVGLSTQYEIEDLATGEHAFEVRAANVDIESVGGEVCFKVISSNITVSDFAVEPTDGLKPLEVDVTAELENEGNTDEKISMYVDHEELEIWNLEAGEVRSVEESIVLEEAGTYLVGMGDESTEVEVKLSAPEFTVDEFEVEPREGEEPLEVEISAEVTNIGVAEGEISLYIDDQEIKTWTLEPDENITVDETHEITEAGDYIVVLGDESAELSVEESSTDIPFASLPLFLTAVGISVAIYSKRT